MKLFCLGLVMEVLFCVGSVVEADTLYWTTYGAGDWSIATNWTNNKEPTSTDEVLLNNGGTTLVTQTGEVCSLLRFGVTAGGWGRLEMNSGSLTTGRTYLGTMYSAYGIFIQNGGIHSTTDLTLAYNSKSSSCSYTLNGGQLTVSAGEDIGYRGQGIFTHTGGENNTNSLAVGANWDFDHPGGSGLYTLSGGCLKANKIYIGTGCSNSGTLDIQNASAEIYVNEIFQIDPAAHFSAAANSVIHMGYLGTKAAALGIWKTSSEEIAGLANTEFTFAAVPGKTSTIELAGRDLGNTQGGFSGNFALGGLTLEENASVRLIDNYDNQPAWTGKEALYVNHLRLGAGATLDCNCFRIYYNTIENLGGTIINGSGDCDKITVSASPAMIVSDGLSRSTITATLMINKNPVPNEVLWISTNKGTLESPDAPEQGSSVMAITDSAGKADVELISTVEPGTATITVEHPDTGLVSTCTVEITNLRLTMESGDIRYTEVPANQYHWTKVVTRPASSLNEVTLYGETIVPITLRIADDSGQYDVANQLIALSSPQLDMVGAGHLDFPAFIATEPNGFAHIEVKVTSLWEAESVPDDIVIEASLQSSPDIKTDISLTVFNNWQQLIDYLPLTLKRGYIWNFSLLNQLEKRGYGKVVTELRELFEVGVEGSLNNMILNNVTYYAGMMDAYNEIDATKCGGYQAAILYLFDALRLNQTKTLQGQPDKTDWLFNGIDYGPIHFAGGFHVAAMMYPRIVGHVSEWRTDNTRILDPWLQQDPVNAVYTWDEWATGATIALFGATASSQFLTSNFVSPFFIMVPENPINKYYPANGHDYPAEPNESMKVDMNTFSTLIVRCPVRVTLTDVEGRRSGYDPDKEGSQDEFAVISDIPGVFWCTVRLPDGTAAWLFGLPENKNLTATIEGYDSGTVHIDVLPGAGPFTKYKTSITSEQTVSLQFATNNGASPGLALDDGSLRLPEYTVQLKDWSMRQTPAISIGSLIVENQQDYPLYGPLTVTIEALAPDSIKPLNTNGTKDGKLIFDLTALTLGQPLAPGQRVTMPVVFDNPDHVLFDIICQLEGFTEQGTRVRAFFDGLQIGQAVCGDGNHPCADADMNLDCSVDTADLMLVLEQWLKGDCGQNADCMGMDLNRNGAVEIADIAVMASEWMTCNDPASPCFIHPDSTPHSTTLPPDMAERNAYDWLAWAEESSPAGTYVLNDMQHSAAGQSSIRFITDGGFDTCLRYPLAYDADWNLSTVSHLNMAVYSTNTNGFQGSPVIRLKTDDNNYFEYLNYRDGGPCELFNEAFENWMDISIPLNAGESEENGWRRSTVGLPDMAHIRQLEIHADTWDCGFNLWIDGIYFD